MHEWMTIRELARQKVSVCEIAQQTGRDRKTNRTVISDAAPKTQRVVTLRRVSKLDPYREYVHQRVAQGCPNGAVLLEEIRERGYTGQISILRDFLTPLRRDAIRAREATERFETGPGKQAQVDWGTSGRSGCRGRRAGSHCRRSCSPWAIRARCSWSLSSRATWNISSSFT